MANGEHLFTDQELTMLESIVLEVFNTTDWDGYVATNYFKLTSNVHTGITVVFFKQETSSIKISKTQSFTLTVNGFYSVSYNLQDNVWDVLSFGSTAPLTFDVGGAYSTCGNYSGSLFNPLAKYTQQKVDVDVTVPDILVPEAKVEINNTTDVTQAMQNYVPSSFITVIPILIAMVIAIKLVKDLIRKR